MKEKIEKDLTGKDEEIYNALLKVIRYRIGNKHPQEWIDSVEEEGIKRFEEKIPPGFNDEDKDQSNEDNENIRKYGDLTYQRKYGDLILWKDLIKHLQENKIKNKKIILVTNDGTSSKKNDIMYRVNGMTVGPNISLLNEMLVETDNKLKILNNTYFVKLVNSLSDEDSKKLENAVQTYYARQVMKNNNNIIGEQLSELLSPDGTIDSEKLRNFLSHNNMIDGKKLGGLIPQDNVIDGKKVGWNAATGLYN